MTTPALQDLTTEDRKLYFAGTFLRVTDSIKKKSRWGYCHSFSEGMAIMKFGDGPGAKAEVFPLRSSRFNLENFIPKTGAYNTPYSVCLVRRAPTRQTKKGICPDTIKLDSLTHSFASLGWIPNEVYRKDSVSFGVKFLDSVFLDHSYLPITKAFQAIRMYRRLAVAISPDFYLSANPQAENPNLWFRGTSIGEVVSPRRLLVSNQLFAQEAADMFPGCVEVVK